ncbi:Retrovirus-related Pol polyprotein [Aphis craccivora]|uniref:Retrovirus-related Pol polyprotein n=1 Tax=Aphis craccivora TaxID=307492 RepID=A0A6G0YZF2_APHCR|nr:Retrovirus-related Pol polyprotein [Aphis craccivora]
MQSAWDSIPAADKTINNLTSRLLIEESRLKQRSLTTVVENQKSIALTANSSKKNVKFGSKGKINEKQGNNCHFCNLPGNWKYQYKKYLQNKEIKKTNRETSKTNDFNAFVTEIVNIILNFHQE